MSLELPLHIACQELPGLALNLEIEIQTLDSLDFEVKTVNFWWVLKTEINAGAVEQSKQSPNLQAISKTRSAAADLKMKKISETQYDTMEHTMRLRLRQCAHQNAQVPFFLKESLQVNCLIKAKYQFGLCHIDLHCTSQMGC